MGLHFLQCLKENPLPLAISDGSRHSLASEKVEFQSLPLCPYDPFTLYVFLCSFLAQSLLLGHFLSVWDFEHGDQRDNLLLFRGLNVTIYIYMYEK